jgi:hypothetical protein
MMGGRDEGRIKVSGKMEGEWGGRDFVLRWSFLVFF